MTGDPGPAATPADANAGTNRYVVRTSEDGGWSVEILDPHGEVVFRRACADEAEARLFASTVEQHVHWLSEEKFRTYYKLPEPGA